MWNLSHHRNKQTLNLTYGWHTFGILLPIRRHEGNGTTSTGIPVDTAHRDSLTDTRTALRSIQNYGNVFHIYYPVQSQYFLAHSLIITCWNEQTQQSTCPRMTIPTAVYHWQYPLQFIAHSTDHIRHISRKWNLQPVTSWENDAMQCALAWDVPGLWPTADNPTRREWCRNDACHTHHWRMSRTELFVYHTDTRERNVDCQQTMSNKCWQLPATLCNSSVPVLPEPRELLWRTWANSSQTINLHKSRRLLQCWHTWGGSEGVSSSFRLK
jgi:hypothetical protein